MSHLVVVDPRRAHPADVAELAQYGTATVHEALGQRGLLPIDLRPIWPGARIAGTAVTVLCSPGDNLMIHVAAEQCRPGDVMVVTTTQPSVEGFFGELLATQLAANGVLGLITTTGVRDVARLKSIGFPVWSRAVSAQGTENRTGGEVNTPLVIGTTNVHPGDVIVADDDGVVCVPLEAAQEIAKAAAARTTKEDASRVAYQNGELSLDRNGLRQLLDQLGVEYVAAVQPALRDGRF